MFPYSAVGFSLVFHEVSSAFVLSLAGFIDPELVLLVCLVVHLIDLKMIKYHLKQLGTLYCLDVPVCAGVLCVLDVLDVLRF